MKFIKHSLILVIIVLIFYPYKNGMKANTPMLASMASFPVPTALDSMNIRQGLIYHRLDSLFAYKYKYTGFNGNVLVLKGGRVIYKGCFGYCNYSTKDTLNEKTTFQIASSSKPFTSTAILKLVEQGKLSLTDTLGKFFPGFPY